MQSHNLPLQCRGAGSCGGWRGRLWGCSSHGRRDTLAWLAGSSTGCTSFWSKVRPLQSPQAQAFSLQQCFLEGRLRRNRCWRPALPFCRQPGCSQPRSRASQSPPCFSGSIPMPCFSPSLGHGPAVWLRGALVEMGNPLGGHHQHHWDFMLAELNKWCVLVAACGLCPHQVTGFNCESWLGSGTRGWAEIATVHGRGCVK